MSAGIEPAHAFWHQNYYDDYAGYDLDGNGVGDLPYEMKSASEELITRHPNLAFFRGTPTLGIVDASSKLLPLWTPRTFLVDDAPRMPDDFVMRAIPKQMVELAENDQGRKWMEDLADRQAAGERDETFERGVLG